jgi:hypothetical protein
LARQKKDKYKSYLKYLTIFIMVFKKTVQHQYNLCEKRNKIGEASVELALVWKWQRY